MNTLASSPPASLMPAPRLSVGRLLEPASIAVIGASTSRAKYGGRIMYHLLSTASPAS